MRSRNVSYVPSVDHLRLLAALLVLFFHGNWVLSAPAGPDGEPAPHALPTPHAFFDILFIRGQTGVALFMVVSGFILTYGALRRPMRYGAFLRNRALRILPMLTFLTLIGIALYPGGFGLGRLVRQLLLLPGSLAIGRFYGLTWSVYLELQFYIFYPFILRGLQRRGPKVLLLIMAATIGGRAAALGLGMTTHTVLYATLLGRMNQFLIGMLAAWLILNRPSRRWVAALPVGLVAVTALLYTLPYDNTEPARWGLVWHDVEGLFWGMVVIGYVTATRTAAGPVTRALAALGERTYSVYLLQQLVLEVLFRTGIRVPLFSDPWLRATITMVLLGGPLVFGAAALTYRFVERPFLRRRVRYLGAGQVEETRTHPPAALPGVALPERASAGG